VPTASPAWERLGEQLVRRRIEVDPRYSNRQLFADERGVNYRSISDIERGRRDNYEDATIASLEVAYAVRPGSIRRAVDGGDLEPLQAAPARLRAAPPPASSGSPAEEILADLLARYPDDKIITDVLGGQLQNGKAARVIVNEILEWLDFLESKDIGDSGLPQNGASAGLPAGKLKETLRLRPGNVRSWPYTFV
jgi:hypothetical protein